MGPILIVVIFLLFFKSGYNGSRQGYYGISGFTMIGTAMMVLLILTLLGGPRAG